MSIKPDRELNIKGEVCPFTFVKTKLQLESMESGEVLRVVVDHEPATKNVPRSAENEGHELILWPHKFNDTDWEFIIKKK
ncbi:MAG: sulfurtransferase TusA family protein [Nitrospinota bacterium]|nr:sulfurtransferase TusA family protein [Nitrospinota bacterium]